jgi:hypothetical protein
MEIKYVQSEYITTEESYTCVASSDNFEIVMVSYVYNNKLAPDETAPSFHNSDKFKNLDEKTQEYIIKEVNKKINEYLT